MRISLRTLRTGRSLRFDLFGAALTGGNFPLVKPPLGISACSQYKHRMEWAGIKFRYAPPASHRCHIVDEEDVKVVLKRLPRDLWKNLKGVHFLDRSRGRRVYGYVTPGRQDIALCALPPSVSLASGLPRGRAPVPLTFGALRNCQWPILAVRRFMLYHVLLHEIGHIQVVNPRARNMKRKYALEKLAEDFAESIRKQLWSEPFEHPDPVHNPPSRQEVEKVQCHWEAAHRACKKGLRYEEQEQPVLAATLYAQAIAAYDTHALALEALGIFTYCQGNAPALATGLLKRAVEALPTSHDANVFLGISLAAVKNEAAARRHLERAVPLSRTPWATLAVYANIASELGYYHEAERRFDQALRLNSRCPFVRELYKKYLLNPHNPDRDSNSTRARALFPGISIKPIEVKVCRSGKRLCYQSSS